MLTVYKVKRNVAYRDSIRVSTELSFYLSNNFPKRSFSKIIVRISIRWTRAIINFHSNFDRVHPLSRIIEFFIQPVVLGIRFPKLSRQRLLVCRKYVPWRGYCTLRPRINILQRVPFPFSFFRFLHIGRMSAFGRATISSQR